MRQLCLTWESCGKLLLITDGTVIHWKDKQTVLHQQPPASCVDSLLFWMAQLNVELEYAPMIVDWNQCAIRLPSLTIVGKFDHCGEGLGNTSDKDKET